MSLHFRPGYQFMCDIGLSIKDYNPPHDLTLPELPFSPGPSATLLPRVKQNSTTTNLFDHQQLRTQLGASYDFRKTFLESLGPTDLSNAVHVFGIELTPKEKSKDLNPLLTIFSDITIIKELIRQGWGITLVRAALVGGDIQCLLRYIFTPVEAADKLKRSEVMCALLFTPPLEHMPRIKTTNTTLAKLFPRVDDALKQVYNQNSWSCSRMTMSSIVKFDDDHLQFTSIERTGAINLHGGKSLGAKGFDFQDMNLHMGLSEIMTVAAVKMKGYRWTRVASTGSRWYTSVWLALS